MSIPRSSLREKAWYRAVKVLFVAGDLLAVIFIFWSSYINSWNYVCTQGIIPKGRCFFEFHTGEFLSISLTGLAIIWVASYLVSRIFFFVVSDESFWKRPHGIFYF